MEASNRLLRSSSVCSRGDSLVTRSWQIETWRRQTKYWHVSLCCVQGHKHPGADVWDYLWGSWTHLGDGSLYQRRDVVFGVAHSLQPVLHLQVKEELTQRVGQDGARVFPFHLTNVGTWMQHEVRVWEHIQVWHTHWYRCQQTKRPPTRSTACLEITWWLKLRPPLLSGLSLDCFHVEFCVQAELLTVLELSRWRQQQENMSSGQKVKASERIRKPEKKNANTWAHTKDLSDLQVALWTHGGSEVEDGRRREDHREAVRLWYTRDKNRTFMLREPRLNGAAENKKTEQQRRLQLPIRKLICVSWNNSLLTTRACSTLYPLAEWVFTLPAMGYDIPWLQEKIKQMSNKPK